MELLTPDIGLIFWTVIFFLIAWGLLAKFAWKPIINMLAARDKGIKDSLEQAHEARKKAESVQADTEKMLRETRQERDRILAEAQKMYDRAIESAKEDARAQVEAMMKTAAEAIENEKQQAIYELKAQIASISVELASKVLQEELKDSAAQQKMLDESIKDITIS